MKLPRTRIPPRLRSGWTAAVLIALVVLAVWLPDLDLPLGDSDDGRILARFGLSARNFWEQGASESGYGALIEPYIRAEYGVGPGETPPRAAVTYAHHPPFQTFATIVSVGLLGDSPAGLRALGFLMGAATVIFMTALLRIRGIGWGPTLLAVGSMAATGFFFVYGRIGVGFSLIAASAAMVAYLREARDPPPSVLAAGAVLAGLTAMQSWIAMAAVALLILWLLPAAGWRVARWTALGALAGVLVTAAWLLNSTDLGELGNRVAFRVDTDRGTFGEFLARQWRFAAMFTPAWFRYLAPFALLAGVGGSPDEGSRSCHPGRGGRLDLRPAAGRLDTSPMELPLGGAGDDRAGFAHRGGPADGDRPGGPAVGRPVGAGTHRHPLRTGHRSGAREVPHRPRRRGKHHGTPV